MKLQKLSNRELEVMHLLWKSANPLIASEIVNIDKDLTVNTVHAALRNLLKKEYIRVSDVIINGTSLARSYEPIVTQGEYLDYFFPAKDRSNLSFVANFVKSSSELDDLEELSILLEKKKKELERG